MAEITEFPQVNAIFKGDGKTIADLPCHIDDEQNLVVSCWKLSETDKQRILDSGEIFLGQLTFGNPLQPQAVWFQNPFVPEETKCICGAYSGEGCPMPGDHACYRVEVLGEKR